MLEALFIQGIDQNLSISNLVNEITIYIYMAFCFVDQAAAAAQWYKRSLETFAVAVATATDDIGDVDVDKDDEEYATTGRRRRRTPTTTTKKKKSDDKTKPEFHNINERKKRKKKKILL